MNVSLDTELSLTAERFDSYGRSIDICAPLRTVRLPTPPLAAPVSGPAVGSASPSSPAAASTASLERLDPTLRQLAYHCNRLCAGAVGGAHCAYFLARGGHLHRVAATAQGGSVDASASGPLPGWPPVAQQAAATAGVGEDGVRSASLLATLHVIRNAPGVPNSPSLLACDGRSQLYVCDADGDPLGGTAIPLPLPPGCTANDGWNDWLLSDAAWSAVAGNSAGRVDVALLGYRRHHTTGPPAMASPTMRWCTLSVTIMLPSPATPPSLHAAAHFTEEQPNALRCGDKPGQLQAVIVMTHRAWGSRAATATEMSTGVVAEVQTEGAETGQGGGGGGGGGGREHATLAEPERSEQPAAATLPPQAGDDGAKEFVDEDCSYSYPAAVVLAREEGEGGGGGGGGTRLVVHAFQPLEGFQPLAAPDVSEFPHSHVLGEPASEILNGQNGVGLGELHGQEGIGGGGPTVLLCELKRTPGVGRLLQARHEEEDRPARPGPHAHVFEWAAEGCFVPSTTHVPGGGVHHPAATARTGAGGKHVLPDDVGGGDGGTGGSGGGGAGQQQPSPAAAQLLRHVDCVAALGYICSARWAGRFRLCWRPDWDLPVCRVFLP
jgi:hypothetical protein